MPSTWPSRAAYIRAAPRAVMVPSDVGDDQAMPVHRDLQAGFRSGGHHLVGRGLDIRLQVSHRP